MKVFFFSENTSKQKKNTKKFHVRNKLGLMRFRLFGKLVFQSFCKFSEDNITLTFKTRQKNTT